MHHISTQQFKSSQLANPVIKVDSFQTLHVDLKRCIKIFKTKTFCGVGRGILYEGVDTTSPIY